jgi:hypothetical protein
MSVVVSLEVCNSLSPTSAHLSNQSAPLFWAAAYTSDESFKVRWLPWKYKLYCTSTTYVYSEIVSFVFKSKATGFCFFEKSADLRTSKNGVPFRLDRPRPFALGPAPLLRVQSTTGSKSIPEGRYDREAQFMESPRERNARHSVARDTSSLPTMGRGRSGAHLDGQHHAGIRSTRSAREHDHSARCALRRRTL